MKLLHYKETANSIFLGEEVTFRLNTDTFECEDFQFCDPHHKHIITEDISIIGNLKLRKLMAKCLNYRERLT